MIVWEIERHGVVGSTNDFAKAAAKSGANEGLVITAEQQMSGRGRHGRVWASPAGNLYSSILLKPKIEDVPFCSFVTALAVAEVVRGFLPHASVALKWPNDVLVDAKKISGVLLEVEGDALVIGTGINIAHHPVDTPYPCTSLAGEGVRNIVVEQVLSRYLEALGKYYSMLCEGGFAPIRDLWLQQALRGSMSVKVGENRISGEFVGVDAAGRLSLRLADGQEKVIASGDVFALTV